MKRTANKALRTLHTPPSWCQWFFLEESIYLNMLWDRSCYEITMVCNELAPLRNVGPKLIMYLFRLDIRMSFCYPISERDGLWTNWIAVGNMCDFREMITYQQVFGICSSNSITLSWARAVDCPSHQCLPKGAWGKLDISLYTRRINFRYIASDLDLPDIPLSSGLGLPGASP